MKLAALKEYIRRKANPDITEIDQYLRTELQATLRELRTALNRITFQDNFEGWISEIQIPANSELAIPNEIRKPVNYWITLRKNEGGIYVADGDTDWNENLVYLKNTSGSLTASLTVAFIV